LLDIKAKIVNVPDFPKPGIVFRDIVPLLRDHFSETIAALAEKLSATEWKDVDVIVGIESRGFVLAAALAEKFGKGFVPVRKQGKLPPPIVALPYQLEYGTGVLEMQRGSGRALLIDDVLATGGTLLASGDLCQRAGYDVTQLLVLIDLRLVENFSWRGKAVRSVVQYQVSADRSA
jgi:adenine phosphoribosyltransferase